MRTLTLSEEAARLPSPPTVPGHRAAGSADTMDPLVRMLADLKLALIRSDLSSGAAAVAIRETEWPEGSVEYQRALLRLGHMIGTWHTENKSAIALIDKLIALAAKRL